MSDLNKKTFTDYISKYNDNNVLYHHGILGQKWGQRNGPPYPLGSGAHSAREQKAGWRKSLSNSGSVSKKRTRPTNSVKKSTRTNKSTEQNNTRKKFELSENAKRNIKKALIIGGVTAGTIGAIYLYRRIGQDYFDKTIKAGTVLQTWAADPDRIRQGQHFYTTFYAGDRRAYNKVFSATFIKKQGVVLQKYKNLAVAEKDAKIASNRSAKRVYDQLMKNNPEFRSLVRKSFDTSEYTDHGKEKKLHETAKRLLDKNSKRSTYVAFNRSTLLSEHVRDTHKKLPDTTSQQAKKIFYDEMKRKGYSGLNDINDQRYSGFKNVAKSPTIVFDRDFLKKDDQGRVLLNSQKRSNWTNNQQINRVIVRGRRVVAQIEGNAKTYGPGAAAGVGANYVYNLLEEDEIKSNKK